MTAAFIGGLFPSIGIFAMLCAATLFAAGLRGFSGFGSGLALAPLYSLFLQPTDVVVVILLLNLITSLQMLPQAIRVVRWPLVISLFIPCLFGIPLGLLALHFIDVTLMRKLVAVVVTLMSAILLSGWHYQGRRGPLQNGIAGLTSGALTALAGIGGPPILVYLLSADNHPPAVLRAIFIVYFALAQVATLIPLLLFGSINTTQAAYVGSLLPVYFIATALGTIAHQRMERHKDGSIRRISLLFLLAIGIITFFV